MFVGHDRVAADLIAEIRHRSRLSQAQLARRCGIPPSVLSAYQHGKRQPSVAALARIAGAAGLELQLAQVRDEAALRYSGRVLLDVLELADALPSKHRGELKYPPLIRLAA